MGSETNYPSGPLGGMQCQIVRSCTKWSHGVPLEHSIADAYIDVIRKSEHFVYIENQFFHHGDRRKAKADQEPHRCCHRREDRSCFPKWRELPDDSVNSLRARLLWRLEER